MTEQRHNANTITDAALDALYERLAKAERATNLLAYSHRRAEQAEAAIERMRAWCDRLDADVQRLTRDPTAVHPVAVNIRHQLASPKE